MDVFSMEQGIWLGFDKTYEFGGGGFEPPQIPAWYATGKLCYLKE
jgi:hypothetical protein